ncbi:hypothetical protein KIH74_23025 [Kineosporia sp. J2-2]|uniref:Uncharacterized protein n=1 Tax=Kineosporia corallincola TaxID=2835133 RepID=A0ABS5TLV5_9ACTN|nr:hypothetical protein [Kineosporia corallincola]MBT0771833.1 hypothetical protein [Kineosporia corallincola]
MPGHGLAYERLSNGLRATTEPARRDELLDEWIDMRDLATNYDADQWGLNPDDPMWDQLDQQEAR